MTEQMTGAQALVRALEQVGVDTVFGIPGGAILPAYDPLYDSAKVRHVLVRHEQGAGHAAQGYAQATGKVGVCMATSGPGATNLVTPIADAYMDSVPMVAITGQVASAAIGTDAFQEADISGITMPITKHNFLVTDPEDIPRTIAEAFHIASTGRPGPVLVDIAKDALQADDRPSAGRRRCELPGYRPVTRPHSKQIREAAKLITEAKRPVLYVGGGVHQGAAPSAELLELAELTEHPGRHHADGARRLPRQPPAAHGHARHARHRSPRSARCRRPTCSSRSAPASTTASPASCPPSPRTPRSSTPTSTRPRSPRTATRTSRSSATAREVIADLDRRGAQAARPQGRLRRLVDAAQRLARRPTRWATTTPRTAPSPRSTSSSARASSSVPTPSTPPASASTRCGPPSSSATRSPGTFINSGGAGTMGFAVPAAMGAKVGRPDTTVWAIDGDGCFQMTNQELATCAIEGVPIKVAIINNGDLGMVRQWQTLFYNERYSNTDLQTARRIPDFVKLAEAYGCVGLRCERPEDVDATIEKAMEINDVPVVIDFVVHQDAMVWPMVAAGTSNDEIKFARDMAPSGTARTSVSEQASGQTGTAARRTWADRG